MIILYLIKNVLFIQMLLHLNDQYRNIEKLVRNDVELDDFLDLNQLLKTMYNQYGQNY